MSFYEGKARLTQWRDKEVQYPRGGSELLPFEDCDFSLVVIDIVLDHTKSPRDVLRKTYRVLVLGRFLYLAVNIHTQWGLLVRSLMEMFQLDTGHPYSYTKNRLRRLVKQMSFEIRNDEIEDRRQARKTEIRAAHVRSKLKAMLGISDIKYEILAEKS